MKLGMKNKACIKTSVMEYQFWVYKIRMSFAEKRPGLKEILKWRNAALTKVGPLVYKIKWFKNWSYQKFQK